MLNPDHGCIKRARQREAKILAAITEAALDGRPCPTTEDLSEIAGYDSKTGSYKAVQRLALEGTLTIRQAGWYRIIGITRLGIETADPYAKRMQPERRPIADFYKIAAETAGLTYDDLVKHGNRAKLYSRPRIIACHFARAEGWSYPEIGRASNRDHSTIVYACNKVEALRKHDRLFERLFKRTEDALRGMAPAPTIPFVPARIQKARFELGDSGELAPIEPEPRKAFDPLLFALKREHPERCAA